MGHGLRVRGVYNLFMETTSKETRCSMVAFSRFNSRLCYHFPQLLAVCVENTDSICCMPFNRCHLLACSDRHDSGLVAMWKQINDIVQSKSRGYQDD